MCGVHYMAHRTNLAIQTLSSLSGGKNQKFARIYA